MMCVGCDNCDGTGRWCVDVRLSPTERDIVSTLLRREGSRLIGRIEAGDTDAMRDVFLDAARPLDDIADRIDRASRGAVTHVTVNLAERSAMYESALEAAGYPEDECEESENA